MEEATDNTVLLGKMLEHLRRRKGVSQASLAECLGWSGTSPVVAIEKGRRIPEARTIERWVNCLDGTYPELYYALGLAGFIPPTRMPLLNQIKSVLGTELIDIQSLMYPAYIIDYRGTFWALNATASAFTNQTSLKSLLAQKAHILDVVANSRLHIRDYMVQPDQVELEQIIRFRAVNLYRQHEPFFLAYPHTMKDRLHLPREDFKRFGQSWATAAIRDVMVNNISFKWALQPPGYPPLFFTIAVQTYPTLNNLFNLVIHKPSADTPVEVTEATEQFLAPFRQKAHITLWDTIDAQDLLDEYRLR